MVSPLACQVGSCLVWPCCFPRLVLFGLVPSPPPLWSGACGLFGWPRPAAPPVGGSVFYRRTVGLLPLVSSNVIVRVPCPLPPPLWGGACGRFGWPRPACVGQCVLQILQRYVWYGCCRLLAVMSSLRARYHTKLLFSPCKRCPCPCSGAVHSPSSPPSGLRGFVPVVRGPGVGGGGGVGARNPRAYMGLRGAHGWQTTC